MLGFHPPDIATRSQASVMDRPSAVRTTTPLTAWPPLTVVMTPPEIKRVFAARAIAVTSADGALRLSINATTSTPASASVLTVEAA